MCYRVRSNLKAEPCKPHKILLILNPIKMWLLFTINSWYSMQFNTILEHLIVMDEKRTLRAARILENQNGEYYYNRIRPETNPLNTKMSKFAKE